MQEKLKIIELIKNSDISNFEWSYNILDLIQNQYAKGYLTAQLENTNKGIESTTEDFRDDFLKFCEYDIWK